MSSIASFSSLMAAGEAVEPDRSAPELVDDGMQEPPVRLVEALLVDLQQGQGVARDLHRDGAVGPHLGVVAHAPQQPVGDARRAARPAGRFSAVAAASMGTPSMRPERVTISTRSRSA